MNTHPYGPEYAERLKRFHDFKHGAILREEVLIVLAQEAFSLEDKLLEVGCGIGKFCEAIKRVYPHFVVVGYDPNLGNWRQNVEDTTGVRYTDDPDSIGGGYRGVLCTNVLGHMSDPETELRSMHSRLLPGGLLLLTIPSMRYEQAMTLSNLVRGYRSDPTLLHRWHGPELERLVQSAGFREVRSYGLTPKWFGMLTEDTVLIARK